MIRLLVAGCLACVAIVSAAEKEIKINFLSATIKDKAIPQAQVYLQKTGNPSVTDVTDNSGNVTIKSPFAADDASVTLIAKKEGYSNLVAKCPCDKMSYAMSEKITDIDGLRVVLNWADSPKDLDSHLRYAGNHIFFDSKKGESADLDVDDTDGYGPETITLRKKLYGKKYVYAVHNFSDAEVTRNIGTLSDNSKAKVFLYVGTTLVKTYYIPTGKPGTLWVVFGIDERGEIHDINKFTSAPTPQKAGEQLESYINSPTFESTPQSISEQDIALAKKTCEAGAKIYHDGNIEKSIELYKQAIELYPAYGQAFSNLGLSYQKNGQISEALWANKEAIRLATSNNTKAYSYYNIATIYEQQGKWLDAKLHYQWALENREHTAYHEGIARMKAKLGEQ